MKMDFNYNDKFAAIGVLVGVVVVGAVFITIAKPVINKIRNYIRNKREA